MCGIIGIVGREPVAPRLLESLRRLEYRGYDSAGIAVAAAEGVARRRAEGKIRNLEAVIHDEPVAGDVGIGHTRWATHGAPSVRNAHPHAYGAVTLVHNGIIENYAELKAELQARGHVFESDTDTEVIAHLLDEALATAAPRAAFQSSARFMRSAVSDSVVMYSGHSGFLVNATGLHFYQDMPLRLDPDRYQIFVVSGCQSAYYLYSLYDQKPASRLDTFFTVEETLANPMAMITPITEITRWAQSGEASAYADWLSRMNIRKGGRVGVYGLEKP